MSKRDSVALAVAEGVVIGGIGFGLLFWCASAFVPSAGDLPLNRRLCTKKDPGAFLVKHGNRHLCVTLVK